MTRAARTRLAVIAALIAALEFTCRLGAIDRKTLIAPSEMTAALAQLLASGGASSDITRSLAAVLAACALAILLGFAMGILIRAWPRLRRALDPFFATYYAVPFFVFYPVLVAIFGLSIGPVIAIGFLFAVVAMIVNTLTALDRMPGVLAKVGRVHRLSRLQTAWRLQLPAAAPFLFVGVRLAVAYSFIGVIASEFIMGGAGVGYRIAYAYNNFDNRVMYALMLLVLVLVTAVNLALHGWERRLARRRGLA
jgi:NitT/TauT family transport system permease protein